jgi:hypothetical protein
MPGNQDPVIYGRNLILASVAGQVGCTTVVLLVGALLLGLWLDSLIGIKGLCTITLLLLSVPLSLTLVLRMALRAARAIQPPVQGESSNSNAPTVKED